MINNIYYYFIKNSTEINIINYITIYSIITIQNPKKIYIYYNKNLDCYYYDKLKNTNLWEKYNVELIFVNIKNKIFENILLKDMNDYGGIYINQDIILLRNIENFLIHDKFKLNNNLIGLRENNNYKKIIEITEDDDIFNIQEDLMYEADNKIIDIIFDYNFSDYFNIVYNFYILNISKLKIKNKIYRIIIENKINTLNLIIYYLLGYNYYFNNKIINNEIIEDNIHKINKIDKIYYINLDRNEDRNIKMNETLNKLNIDYIRYEGLDGKKYNNIKNDKFNKKENIICNSNCEYAVLYSHLSLIKKLEYEKGEYFLILEDDLCLDFINYWDNSIENIIENAPNDWEIIMLGYFTLDLKFKSNYRKWNNDWSALSYIIRKSSISKINNYIYNDKFDLFSDVNVADNYIFRVFNTYVYKYPLFTISNNNKSTFHNDHDNYQKIFKNINYLILNSTFDKYL